MTIDTEGYQDFSLSFGEGDVAYPSIVEVGIDPSRNNGCSLMCIYCGTLNVNVQGKSASKWQRGTIVLKIPTGGRRWTTRSQGFGWTMFCEGCATASLASVFNKSVSKNAGWAVDGAIVEPRLLRPPQEDYLSLQAHLAVSDSDGFLYRIAYQVTAKGIPPAWYPTVPIADPGLTAIDR